MGLLFISLFRLLDEDLVNLVCVVIWWLFGKVNFFLSFNYFKYVMRKLIWMLFRFFSFVILVLIN